LDGEKTQPTAEANPIGFLKMRQPTAEDRANRFINKAGHQLTNLFRTEIRRCAARRYTPVQNAYKPSAFFSQPRPHVMQNKTSKRQRESDARLNQ
jgi:hypothetical protein